MSATCPRSWHLTSNFMSATFLRSRNLTSNVMSATFPSVTKFAVNIFTQNLTANFISVTLPQSRNLTSLNFMSATFPGRKIWRKISCLRIFPGCEIWRHTFYVCDFSPVAKIDVKFHVCDFSPVAKFDVKCHVCDFPLGHKICGEYFSSKLRSPTSIWRQPPNGEKSQTWKSFSHRGQPRRGNATRQKPWQYRKPSETRQQFAAK